jgi:hypothetical protein
MGEYVGVPVELFIAMAVLSLGGIMFGIMLIIGWVIKSEADELEK